MTNPEVLAEAIKQVSLLETGPDSWIDSVLEDRRPRKRVKPTDDDQRSQLEAEFLAPSHTFSTEWLNQLQQYVFDLGLLVAGKRGADAAQF